MKIALRHILVALAWVGLLVGRHALAGDWSAPGNGPPGQQTYESVPAPPSATNSSAAAPPPMPDSDSSVVGEHQDPIGGVFGDTAPGACEFCGGGGCLPPTWSIETSIKVMAMSRAADQFLGKNSLPAGPLSAGSVVVTNSGLQTQENFSQYLNDAVQFTALDVHTPALNDSPALGLKIARFLGRDGEGRDHFIEASFNGLESFTQLADTVHGSIIPFYDTTPFIQQIPSPPPTALKFQGSLISPYPIFLAINGNQQQLIAPSFSILGQNYDQAFNRSDMMSTNYVTSYNEFELNYRFAGHNQPDQLVLNPNGRWYRECQAGYYYSYFFGMKGMVIDEHYNFLSSGSQFAAVNDGGGNFSPGALLFTHQGTYDVHSYNTLLGLQSGGKLEYRFCRWCLDCHGDAGMFFNIASQTSRITTNFGGPTPPTLSDGSTAQNTDTSFSANSNVAAFGGEFGVSGSYKFLPNLTGRLSYDLVFVGDVARAPEQMVFTSVPETVHNLIDTKGSVFYDGFSFGMEMVW